VRITDDDGLVLNAEFSVEPDGGRLAVVLESAGGRSRSGPSRNSGYRAALAVILERLGARRAVLVAAVVDSRLTARLSQRDRALIDDAVDLPACGIWVRYGGS
jgi:hypothetical protein